MQSKDLKMDQGAPQIQSQVSSKERARPPAKDCQQPQKLEEDEGSSPDLCGGRGLATPACGRMNLLALAPQQGPGEGGGWPQNAAWPEHSLQVVLAGVEVLPPARVFQNLGGGGQAGHEALCRPGLAAWLAGTDCS